MSDHSDEKPTVADSVPAINQGFTEGGDLTLRSTDGVEFSVHSLFLSYASPVFSELLQNANKSQVVQFSENAESIALLLRYIYPVPAPNIPSIEMLNDAMRIAHKYQLSSMKARLAEQLVLVDSPVSLYADPLAAFFVAFTHGHTAQAELAGKYALKKYDFGKVETLKKLLDLTPTPAIATLVRILGIPFVKTRVLTEVLFRFELAPMSIQQQANSLICGYCREGAMYQILQRPVEWQIRWARWIFQSINNRPIEEWKDFFIGNHLNLYRAFHQPGLSTSFCAFRYNNSYPTCTCIQLVLGGPGEFQPWADQVYEHLKLRLAFIAELESQIHNTGQTMKTG